MLRFTFILRLQPRRIQTIPSACGYHCSLKNSVAAQISKAPDSFLFLAEDKAVVDPSQTAGVVLPFRSFLQAFIQPHGVGFKESNVGLKLGNGARRHYQSPNLSPKRSFELF